MDREAEEFAEESAANSFMGIFGRFPGWARSKWWYLNSAMSGGDCCNRCMAFMNLLNSTGSGCCDDCEAEMIELLAANPDIVFAFDRGGLRVVA